MDAEGEARVMVGAKAAFDRGPGRRTALMRRLVDTDVLGTRDRALNLLLHRALEKYAELVTVATLLRCRGLQ